LQNDLYNVSFIDHSDPRDHYFIREEIGSGSFGRVFKAVRQKDSLKCALKFIQMDPNAYSETKRLVMNEIYTMHKCGENGGSIKVYDVFEWNGYLFIFVELMENALTDYVYNQY
jgi:serine/threonine protein kinase